MPPRPNYLADLGLDLIELGYPIIPIKPGTKAPQMDGWTKVRATAAQHSRWLKDGYGAFGIGIITEHFPAIDIDTLDAGLADDMINWCDENLAYAPIRVGRAPKTLLPFRTDEPFNKRFSSEWSDNPPQVDANGKPVVHRLEILGRGQQYVAYAVHPDTQQPYTWKSEVQPLNCPSDDLPPLTAAQADQVCAAFDLFAERRGLIRLGRTRSRAAPAVNGHDWTADVTAKVGFTIDQVRETLAGIPNEDAESVSYDDWLQVGMAVFHETDGSGEGFDAWEYWSERSHKHNHAEAQKKWESFAIEGKGRAPITFRYAMKLARESLQAVREAQADQIRAALLAARTKAEFTAAIGLLKETELDALERDAFKPAVMAAYERVYGAKMLAARAAQSIRPAPRSPTNKPDWLAPFVFDTGTDTFFHLETKQALATAAFNRRYDRDILTLAERAAGKVVPEAHASDWATNVYQITAVAGVRYCPWEEPLFHRDGKLYANSYSDALVPATPAKLTHRQEQAIFVFQRHLEHMIIDGRERALFLDWLCHTVRTGRRANWAVVMLGCEGDGKTWFGDLMSRVLGGNVTIAAAASIEDRFNPWAENAQLVVVEEIRFAGHNRHDIMNHLKPLITNRIIEIHRKNQTQYQTVNTAQYLMFTNHADALPVDDATTRYFVIRTRWQRQAQVREFGKENPAYYTELNGVLDDPNAIAAIRKFMLERTPDPEFSAVKRAPESEGKKYMAEMARGDDETALLEEIKRGSNPLLCETLICVAEAQAFLQDATGQFGRADVVGRFLRRAEFESLGQHRVNGAKHSLWSATPEMFQRGRKTQQRLISRYVDRLDTQEV